jgi:cell division protein FtsL
LWGLGAAVVAVSLVVLWHHSRTIQLGYETERMQAEKSRLERIHRELVIERESLASLERVERLAGDLGLVHPSPRNMVVKVEPPASDDEPVFAIAFGRRVLPAEAHAAP